MTRLKPDASTMTAVLTGILIAGTFAMLKFNFGHGDVQAQNLFVAGRLSVTTTATALYTAGSRGSSVLFCNRHTASVFLGGSSALTTANGFELLANDCTTMRPYPRAAIWFIAAAAARVDYAEGQYREP